MVALSKFMGFRVLSSIELTGTALGVSSDNDEDFDQFEAAGSTGALSYGKAQRASEASEASYDVFSSPAVKCDKVKDFHLDQSSVKHPVFLVGLDGKSKVLKVDSIQSRCSLEEWVCAQTKIPVHCFHLEVGGFLVLGVQQWSSHAMARLEWEVVCVVASAR